VVAADHHRHAGMIPEDYVPDLNLRLSLYRRLSSLDPHVEIDAFGAELVDRFGERPPEVDQLLRLMSIKALCRRANIEKVDAGPKGVVLSFRDNSFANPNGLVALYRRAGLLCKGTAGYADRLPARFRETGRSIERNRGDLKNLARIAETRKAA